MFFINFFIYIVELISNFWYHIFIKSCKVEKMMLERLKEARKFLGLNQTQFAEEIGITQTTYSVIENGNGRLTDKRIKTICAIFNISEEWLRTGDGEMLDSSHYIRKLKNISENLTEESKEYLLTIAKNLLRLQKSFIAPKDE